jgi:hypothetical protein
MVGWSRAAFLVEVILANNERLPDYRIEHLRMVASS